MIRGAAQPNLWPLCEVDTWFFRFAAAQNLMSDELTLWGQGRSRYRGNVACFERSTLL